MKKRHLASAAAALAFASPAQAQDYPAKPIRTVMTAAGGVETAARALSQKLGEYLGQPVIVDPQSAAGGAVGATTVARAAPDGYTIAFATTSPMVLRPFLMKNVPYDTLRDFTPVTKVGEAVASVTSSPTVPVNTLKEMIEYARANPGKVSFGSSGIGTTHHLSGDLIMQATGVKMVHVPYKSGGQAIQDLVTGRIQLLFGVMASSLPHIQSGKARLLAINGGSRYKGTPDVPTVSEVIPGYDRPPGWMGYFGPAGLPQPIVKRLYTEIGKAMRDPTVAGVFEKLGLEVQVSESPQQFAGEVDRQYKRAGAMVKAAGIVPE
jgi:tripartite-type tricarboxylate transporter receptor subunit TctC